MKFNQLRKDITNMEAPKESTANRIDRVLTFLVVFVFLFSLTVQEHEDLRLCSAKTLRGCPRKNG